MPRIGAAAARRLDPATDRPIQQRRPHMKTSTVDRACACCCRRRAAALRSRRTGRRAAEVHHHRHRRRDRRLLRRRRRHLPPGQQGPRQARHPLLGRIDRRLGLQRQHHQGRRARLRLRAVRRAVQRAQGRGPVQGRRRLSATCARSSRCIPSRSPCSRARKPTSPSFEDFKGKRFNVGNPGLGHARLDGGAARRAWAGSWPTSRSPPS